MKIIESFCQGKINNEVNEDAILIGTDYAAVIDGVTAKGDYKYDGTKSPGRFAAELIANFFETNPKLDCDAAEFFTELDKYMKESVVNKVDVTELNLWDFPRASFVIYNDVKKQIWSYGDCKYRINNQIFDERKAIDILNEDIRSFVLQSILEKGEEISFDEKTLMDPGRAAISDNLKNQMLFENKPGHWGYPVLNCQGIEPSFISIHDVAAGDEIVLASDGYPILENSLEKSEAELARLLKEDPLCFNENKQTKGLKAGQLSFDDRTYCKLTV